MARETEAQKLARLQAEVTAMLESQKSTAVGLSEAPIGAFVTLPVAPSKRQKAEVVRNAIPLGESVVILHGSCTMESHKSYYGKPYTLVQTGICGDWDGAVIHSGCKRDEKPCNGRVFKAVQPDGATGCGTCARAQRKAEAKQ